MSGDLSPIHPDAGALSIAKEEARRSARLSAETLRSLIKMRYGSTLPLRNVEVIHDESTANFSIQFLLGDSLFRAWISHRDLVRAEHDNEKMVEVISAPFNELKKIQHEAEAKGAKRERELMLAKIEERTRTIKQTETLIVAIADKVGVKL